MFPHHRNFICHDRQRVAQLHQTSSSQGSARCCLKLSSPLTFAVLVLRPDERWVISGLELALRMQDCGAGQHSWAHVPTVRIHLVSYMIISAASRSGAMACFPAGSFLSAADWSIAVGVRSVDVDDFVACSSERFMSNFTATCIESAHLCLFPMSRHQLVAGHVISPAFSQSLSMDWQPHPMSSLLVYFQLLLNVMLLAHAGQSGLLTLGPSDYYYCIVFHMYN